MCLGQELHGSQYKWMIGILLMISPLGDIFLIASGTKYV